MRRFRASLLALALALGAALQAQPPICGPGAVMTSFCEQACIICDIDGFSGVNGNPTSSWNEPAGFCAPTPNNIRWIGFLAGSTDLSLEIAVANCTNPNFIGRGLQFGVYEVIDCDVANAVAVTNCEDRVLPGTSATLTNVAPLVVGQYYYLVIDGWRNDVCDYSVTVTAGSTQVPPVTQGGGITGPLTACPGQTFAYATTPVPGAPNHYWTLDGNPLPGSGLSYDIGFPGAGTYEVCVTASNTCSTAPPECLTVVVADIPETVVPGIICAGECFDFEGVQLCAAGSYPYLFTTAAGCDSLVTVLITELPGIAVTLDTTACAGESITVGGSPYGPGTYAVTLPGVPGACDTVLTLNVTELPSYNETAAETICAGEAFVFNGTPLTSAGTYTEVFATAQGCDSTVALTLAVETPPVTSLTETICFGESYPVGTSTYSATGTYSDVLTSANGCDSTVNLDLTVLPELLTTLDTTVCDEQSVVVGAQTFGASGTYGVTLPSADGCDSTVTLNLTVLPPNATSLSEEICDGQTYTLGTQTLGASGTYTEVFADANGCDSAVTVSLTVLTEIVTTLAETVCDGETYAFGGQTLGTAGTYSQTLPSSGGCDSTVNLTLAVAPTPVTNLTEVICDGETVVVDGQPFGTTGTYTVVAQSAAGCDSTVNLDLTVQTAIATTLDVAICDGDSYTVGATAYTLGGTYTQTLTSAAGCDSTVMLNLTVNPEVTTELVAQVCDGELFAIGQQTFDVTGQYSVTLATAAGCDSNVNLDLTVVETLTETVSATICPNGSYDFNGSTYSAPGSYDFATTSAAGCDSVVTLELSAEPPIATNLVEAVCAGETVTVGTQTFSAAGTYTVVLSAASGCDSTVTLQLIVDQPQSVAVTERICEGGRYVIDGTVLTQPGSYTFDLFTVAGCDSTVALTLEVAPSYFENVSATICPGTSYTLAGQTFTSGGSYPIALTTVDGCDSTIVLEVFEESLIETSVEATVCAGQFYDFNGRQLFNAGQYFETFVTAQGCDSLVTLDLAVVSALADTLTVTRCFGESYLFDGTPRTTSGTYSAGYTSAGGCDSTVTLELTILDDLSTQRTEVICAGESVQVGAQRFSESGTYTVGLIGAGGCDSVITLELSVGGGDTTRLVRGICAGGSVEIGTERFTSTGSYVVDLSTAAGCDSTVTLDLTVASVVALSQNESLCDGESVTVRGTTYATAGNYALSVPGRNGECDTTIALTVTVAPTATTALSERICAGETYRFDGADLDAAGTYTAELETVAGCDSTVVLTLAVLPASTATVAQTICAGETYRFDGRDYAVAGTYTAAFAAANGCDSTVTLVLDVEAPAVDSLAATICTGDEYRAGGRSFSESGTYTVDLTTATGCDSVLVLTLAVTDSIVVERSARICAGQELDFGGQTIRTAGRYRSAGSSSAGCDSVTYLDVTVVDTLRTDISEAICAGETYEFDGSALSDAGTYSALYASAGGCDSLVTLMLAVLPDSDSELDVSICAGDAYAFAGQDYTEAGTYTARLTNAAGCDSLATLRLAVVDTLRAALDIALCAGQVYDFDGASLTTPGTYTQLTASVSGCDSLTVLTLSVSDTLRETVAVALCAGESVDFNGLSYASTGSYRAALASSQGCDSVATLELVVASAITGALDTSICAGEVLRLNGREFAEAGDYTLVYASATGCDSTVALTLALEACGASLTASTEPVRCFGEATGAAVIDLGAFALPITLSYACPQPRGVGDTLITAVPAGGLLRFAGLPAGASDFSVADAAGRTAQVTVAVVGPPERLEGDITLSETASGDAVACAGDRDGTAVVVARGGTAPYAYTWSDGSTQASVEGLGAGEVSVEVRDDNGCPWRGSALLEEPTPLALTVQPDVIDCDDPARLGGVLVDPPVGGVAPFTLVLDGVVVADQEQLTGLGPGEYVVDVVDANGCTAQAVTTLEAPEDPKLDLGADREIVLGDTVSLSVASTLALDGLAWTATPATYLSCDTCARPLTAPALTTRYTVAGTTPAGCTGTAELVIRVRREDGVYWPTAISPNGDRTNDAFTLFAEDPATRILELRVYDRWGEQLFIGVDLEPGRLEQGWPGEFRGEPLNPGVYVWWARVRLRDGREEVVTGDVTLVR